LGVNGDRIIVSDHINCEAMSPISVGRKTIVNPVTNNNALQRKGIGSPSTEGHWKPFNGRALEALQRKGIVFDGVAA